jgi:hypothetical protein
MTKSPKKVIQGPLCTVVKKFFNLEKLFEGHFFTKVSSYLYNLHTILLLLKSICPYCEKQNFGPFYGEIISSYEWA